MKKVVLAGAFAISLTLLLGSAQQAEAMTVIFDSGPPATAGTFTLSPGFPLPFFLAEDFIPDASASVTDFHFFIKTTSSSFLPIGTTFSYEIRDNSAGQPGNIIIGQGTATVVGRDPLPALCSDCFEVWTDFDNPVPVTQGQTFWIVFQVFTGGFYIVDSVPVGNQLHITTDKVNYTPIFFFGGIPVNFPIEITALFPGVGGELLTIDTTALLLAGMQTNLAWIVPVALSAVGIGVLLVRRK